MASGKSGKAIEIEIKIKIVVSLVFNPEKLLCATVTRMARRVLTSKMRRMRLKIEPCTTKNSLQPERLLRNDHIAKN